MITKHADTAPLELIEELEARLSQEEGFTLLSYL
jgi:hypothetical protein